jgi:SUMO ligase MMS21 Smc5/6 complex component
MNKVVLNETKNAYCDSDDSLPYHIVNQQRVLNFKASQPVSVDDAIEIMRKSLCLKHSSDNGYNNFSPSLLKHLPKESEVTLAREGSVCVYVKLPKGKKITKKLATEMLADEFHVEPDGTFRLWWD